MNQSLRKLLLTSHVTTSVGWLGALAAFLVLATVGLNSSQAQLAQSAYVAMDLITKFLIVPLAATSLVTGVIQSLATPWGLVRHYWVLAKLFLTLVATAVLLLKVGPISAMATAAASSGSLSDTEIAGLRLSLLVHAIGGVFILLTLVALSIYKPPGLTRYGLLKAHSQFPEDSITAPSTPNWVRRGKILAVVLLIFFALMVLSGGHGPGAHMHSG